MCVYAIGSTFSFVCTKYTKSDWDACVLSPEMFMNKTQISPFGLFSTKNIADVQHEQSLQSKHSNVTKLSLKLCLEQKYQKMLKA